MFLILLFSPAQANSLHIVCFIEGAAAAGSWRQITDSAASDGWKTDHRHATDEWRPRPYGCWYCVNAGDESIDSPYSIQRWLWWRHGFCSCFNSNFCHFRVGWFFQRRKGNREKGTSDCLQTLDSFSNWGDKPYLAHKSGCGWTR